MQISYHSALTKIQKLQHLKKKKKNLCIGQYCSKLINTAGIFSGMKQGGFICTGLLAGTVYTSRTDKYGTESTPLITTPSPISILFSLCVG